MKYIDWMGASSLYRRAGPKGRIPPSARDRGTATPHLRRRCPTRTQPVTNHSSGTDKKLKQLQVFGPFSFNEMVVFQCFRNIKNHHKPSLRSEFERSVKKSVFCLLVP
jgi:hypothetical protein